MIVIINGPLGIGKSTLAEALTEEIDGCAMLDGDQLVTINPSHPDALEHLHTAIGLMAAHHRRFGYRHLVIDSFWRSAEELEDLKRRLEPLDPDIRCFLLTLPVAENVRRIEQRAGARALDELSFERTTVLSEREVLAAARDGSLGEPFDVSAPPAELVVAMLRRLQSR